MSSSTSMYLFAAFLAASVLPGMLASSPKSNRRLLSPKAANEPPTLVADDESLSIAERRRLWGWFSKRTSYPTRYPTVSTKYPTRYPTGYPTAYPTAYPTSFPTPPPSPVCKCGAATFRTSGGKMCSTTKWHGGLYFTTSWSGSSSPNSNCNNKRDEATNYLARDVCTSCGKCIGGQSTCTGAPTTVPTPIPTYPPGEVPCNRPLDMVILLDESGSVNNVEWNQGIDFVEKFVTEINGGGGGSRIGQGTSQIRISLVAWAQQDQQQTIIKFSDAANLNALLALLSSNNVRAFRGSRTCTGVAAKFAATSVIAASSGNGYRNNAGGGSTVVVWLTDGAPSQATSCWTSSSSKRSKLYYCPSSTGDSTCRDNAMASLRLRTDRIVPVGIGNMQQIASGVLNSMQENMPDMNKDTTAVPHVEERFIRADYNSLDTILDELAHVACPTQAPSLNPTGRPTLEPTPSPTQQPTNAPTRFPTTRPSLGPTAHPTAPGGCTLDERQACGDTPDDDGNSYNPHSVCSCGDATCSFKQCGCALGFACSTVFDKDTAGSCSQCTTAPTNSPTVQPSDSPSASPTRRPTVSPSSAPTKFPTKAPTFSPSQTPSGVPTSRPSLAPSKQPTKLPTKVPTFSPSQTPSGVPTSRPSLAPSTQPTKSPTKVPTMIPSASPTHSVICTDDEHNTNCDATNGECSKDIGGTVYCECKPGWGCSTVTCQTCTAAPTLSPTLSPTQTPSGAPTKRPSESPSAAPSLKPTQLPSSAPSHRPSKAPTFSPSETPSGAPTTRPTFAPSTTPTVAPSKVPTTSPSQVPSGVPTTRPTFAPSATPTARPSKVPTVSPSQAPSGVPTTKPTVAPSGNPTVAPSGAPTKVPTAPLTEVPTSTPSKAPTRMPSTSPTFGFVCTPAESAECDPIFGTCFCGDAGCTYKLCGCQGNMDCADEVCGTCTMQPTNAPTVVPSTAPTMGTLAPTKAPTNEPSLGPTHEPTAAPSAAPTNFALFSEGQSSMADTPKLSMAETAAVGGSALVVALIVGGVIAAIVVVGILAAAGVFAVKKHMHKIDSHVFEGTVVEMKAIPMGQEIMDPSAADFDRCDALNDPNVAPDFRASFYDTTSSIRRVSSGISSMFTNNNPLAEIDSLADQNIEVEEFGDSSRSSNPMRTP